MGNNKSKNQEDVKFYLSKNYKTDQYPTVIRRNTNQICTVHQIVTNSQEESQKIINDVQSYKNCKCESIDKLLQYIPLQSDKICSQQDYHYVVYEGQQTYNLNQEYLARKYYKQRFSDSQIIKILSTYVCGLRQYETKFHRTFQKIDLENISISESTLKMHLKDPLINQRDQLYKKLKKSQNQAPQVNERKSRFMDTQQQYNKYYVDLYKVGLLGLELHRMETETQKDILNSFNNQNFGLNKKTNDSSNRNLNELSQITNKSLRDGIQILLRTNPKQRESIFGFWKVQIQQKYKLERYFKTGNNKNIMGNALFQQNSFSNQLQNGNRSSTFIGKNSNNMSFTSPSSYPNYQNQYLQQVNRNNNNQMIQTSKLDPNSRLNSNSFSFNQSNAFKKSTDVNTLTVNTSTYQKGNYNYSTSKINQPFQIFGSTTNNSHTNFESRYLFNNQNSLKNNAYNSPSILNQSSSKYKFSQTLNSKPINFNTNNNSNNTNNIYVSNPKTNQNAFTITAQPIAKIPTTTSFLYNEKPSISGTEQPSKSPFSQKDLGQSGYRSVFNKYSYLNLDSTPGRIQNKNIQHQMAKLLYSPYGKQTQPINRNNIGNQIQKKEQQQKNYLIGFERQLGLVNNGDIKKDYYPYERFKLQNQKNQTTKIAAYTPNSQVQDILKRLGINELSYNKKIDNKIGDNSNSSLNSNDQMKLNNQYIYNAGDYTIGSENNNNLNGNSQFKFPSSNNDLPQIKSKKLERLNSNNSDQSIIQKVMKETQNNYFQLKRDQNSDLGIAKIQKESLSPASSTEDRLTTPIRAPVRNKYNSTIVQVGDEDSPSEGNDPQHFQPIQEDYVIQQYQTGSRYQGYKHNGMRNGRGKFYYQDGGYYEGMWRDNKMDGWGKLYYQGGKLAYQGNWKQDQFHGYGKVFNDNPSNLNCGFDFTNFDQLEDYWEYYQGMLVQDTKQGRGKIKLCNGQTFEGDFHNDRIQGFGKFTTMEGNIIQGIWRDSKLIKIINN